MTSSQEPCECCGRPIQRVGFPDGTNRWIETWHNGAIAAHTVAMCRAWRRALDGGDWVSVVELLAVPGASCAVIAHIAERMVAAGMDQ